MRIYRHRIEEWFTWRKLRRMVPSAILLVIVVALLMHQLLTNESWTPWSLPLSGKTIYLDPGHGGRDGGAVSRSGIVEKEINLAISFYLRDYLQEAGALVKMTREDDRDLAGPDSRRRKTDDLHKRVELVNDSGADYLITIHMNAMGSSRWRGAQTFYDRNGSEESRELARAIQEELIIGLENTDRTAKKVSNIFILEQAKMPAVLVEAGFLSNEEEARLLADESYQKKVAAAIYRGILRYASKENLTNK